ncbi:hypothetical protein [Blastococcus mobilis]|uniref:Uncharacterized protein n=1 Tax=Blastococcus mobilis TaxID=1938746 RepID=A0A238XEG9_9ACTN|nr:hypothetical protein [Blastococcus mobilis]SNR56873.1 hypothetical protein SAMN06272737_1138 [Blastococcus mobilis]
MSTTRRRRPLLAVTLLALVAAAVGAVLLLRPDDSAESSAQSSAPSATTSAAPGQAVGQGAPTTEAYTLQPEPTFVATDEPRRPTGGSVDVVLTYAGFDPATGTVQANGFAAGVIEDGGTCTLTLTRDSVEVTATGTGTADATTTSCGLLEAAPGLASGTWEARLSYSSEGSSGESDSLEVSVP